MDTPVTTIHVIYIAMANSKTVPLYGLLISQRKPSKTSSKKILPSEVLLDTGAFILLMPLVKAKYLGVQITLRCEGCMGNP